MANELSLCYSVKRFFVLFFFFHTLFKKMNLVPIDGTQHRNVTSLMMKQNG